MSQDTEQHRVRVVELEAEQAIAGLGFEPIPIMPLVKETAMENPSLSATEIVAILRAENPDSFKPRTVATRSAERTLDDMGEAEKAEYVAKHGLDSFLKLVKGSSERRRAEMRRAYQGF